MLDGYKSGMSAIRVSCKSIELKHRMATEMRWNKYKLSVTSSDWEQIPRSSSKMKSNIDELSALRFSTAAGFKHVR